MRIAKNFVADIQRTRDVQPLLSRYYYPRIVYWWGQMDERPLIVVQYHSQDSKLTTSEILRGYRAETNAIYMLNVSNSVFGNLDFGGLEKNLEDEFPDEYKSHSEFLSKMDKWDRTYSRLRSLLRKKNFENTPAYKQHLAKDTECNYVLTETKMDFADDKVSRAFTRLFPKSTPLYGVTTPISLELIFVRYRGTFKIVLTGPCPWD